jgi:hypothetical protein
MLAICGHKELSTAELPAVHARQVEVEHNHARPRPVAQRVQRFASIAGRGYFRSSQLEAAGGGLPLVHIVFHEQNPVGQFQGSRHAPAILRSLAI